MKQRSFLSILCFILITFGVASVSSQTCIQNRKYFTPNSTYDANRQLILASLPSNVSSQDDFHYYGSIGEDPNRIYAIGMCIPGENANDCSNCIKSVSDYLIPSCPNQTDAYYWALTPTLCLIRYSNVSFTGSAAFWEITPQYLVYNTADIITSNLTMFKTIWEDLISRMIMAASTSRSTPSSSDNHYKADVAALTKFQNIYALMQCTPDISSRDCDNCLRQSVIDYQSCCAKKTGGYVMRPICFFQWQLLVFSKAFDNYTSAPPPSLSPPPQRRQPPPARNRAMAKDNSAGKLSTRAIAAIVVVVVAAAAVLIISVYLGCRFFKKRKSYQEEEVELNQTGITTVRSLKYNFKTIEAATNNFSTKIGRGGFGDVFKGTLANGDEVAVKRLSSTSKQGEKEFKNEVVVVAKLQHNNLVRLLGFSVKGKEKILVYEFVRNSSLDSFLSDPTKQGQLGWTKRYNIITGITRGILYLHRDSRLKIIHRDLKAENILLDGDMNPKISDFGMARIFLINQNVADTQRPAGTFGYMPPEYINHGIYSMKSDVYSFGVLILEIICGKKNINFYTNTQNLVTYAWRLWRNGSPLDLVDSTIGDDYPREEVTRCIHIAFLCVQEDPTNRPDLPTISMMLGTNTYPLPIPQPPGLLVPNQSTTSSIYHSCNYNFEVNHVSGTSVISYLKVCLCEL